MKRNFNSGSQNPSTYDLWGCSEEELDRHVRDILHEAGPDGLTIAEVYERVSYRTTKQLVEGMVRDGQLVQLECGYCYLPPNLVRDGRTQCTNPDCEALAKES